MKAVREVGIAREQMTYPQLLRRQAERNGNKPYLVFEGRHFSYREVEALSQQLAGGCLRAGVGKGRHVALLVGNCPETLLLNFAFGCVGAVVCPVNTAAKGDLLEYFLKLCDASVIVVGTTYLERFSEVAPRLPEIAVLIIVDDSATDTDTTVAAEAMATASRLQTAGRRIISYETLAQASIEAVWPEVSPHDVQAIMFTSGTTGPSKGVVIDNAQSFEFSIGRVQYLGLMESDTVYTCLPLFHGNALHAAAVPALLADATLVLARRFSARSFWSDVRNNGVTQFNLLSSMTNILWGAPPSPDDRRHRVRQCTMVPVPSFAQEFKARFGVEIVSSYSLTDFGQGTFLQPGSLLQKMRSAGQPRPDIEVAILDDEDQPQPPGAAGEICLRAHRAGLSGRRYYKAPEETERANRGGWFHTGDRGYLDAEGYLFFLDRKKDAIRRRGENISSWEVEQCIAAYPDVADVAVYAVNSEMSEDEVMASIVCREGRTIDPAALIRFCERNMAYFMVPRYVEIVDSLPRTSTEKVQKQILRESAERRLPEIWDREKAGIDLVR